MDSTDRMDGTIEIPLLETNEVVVIHLEELPECDEIIDILKSEKSNLQIWVDLALEYYKRGNSIAFVKLLESSLQNSNLKYKDSNKDQMRALDTLAAYYVQTASQEKNKDKRHSLFSIATKLYSAADNIIMYDMNHLLGRAFFCLVKGDDIEQADTQFNFILNQLPDCILAQLGKANIAFNRKDYKGSLDYYKKILRSNPNCPADVRLGMAHCFLKLEKFELAKIAFERVLQLNPKSVNALVGLSIMKLNIENADDIKLGINMLSKAYKIDPDNPILLNHLSNHFFFKKEYKKCEQFSKRALQNTENEYVRAESCYQLARYYHIKENNDKAFQYYYQANQLSPGSFILPLYGLGQMYLHRGDVENAIQCFEKILISKPDNYDAMKVLGSLYANSKNQQKQDIAKNHLKKVTENFPDDTDAWIELAQILEQSDLNGSLSAYRKAIHLISLKNNCIPPELLNNCAALSYRLGNLDESASKLKESLAMSKKLVENDPQYYSSISVTTTYNLARIFEEKHQFQKAETFYKDILKEHPNYIDCYLRLGCMARVRNQIYEASIWFKEALRIDNNNANAISLLGNLHITILEWGHAQKKFEHILKNPSTVDDAYSLIALGNIWLQTLYSPVENQEKKKLHQDLAIKFFSKVLYSDPNNLWAANGIGCVLAQKKCINEAKAIFDQVREATADFYDVWLNIAHVYVEQKQFMNAIQMYENCMKKFFKHDNVEHLQYLGRAYFKAGMLKEAKKIFLKAHRVAPQDDIILFNIAFILQKLTVQILGGERPSLKDVLKSAKELELSHKYFNYLVSNVDNTKFDVTLIEMELKNCKDLQSQVQYHVVRARKIDDEECEMRRKQKMEREAIRAKQIEEQTKEIQLLEIKKKEMILKRQEYLEKTKNALIFDSVAEKPINKIGHEFDSSGMIASETDDNKSSHKLKKRVHGGIKEKKVTKAKRKRESLVRNGSEGKPSKKLTSSKKKIVLSSKQKHKSISKVAVTSSEDDKSDGEVIEHSVGISRYSLRSFNRKSRSLTRSGSHRSKSGSPSCSQSDDQTPPTHSKSSHPSKAHTGSKSKSGSLAVSNLSSCSKTSPTSILCAMSKSDKKSTSLSRSELDSGSD